jgi:DNA-binding NarL/FixJ family response regulator
MAYPKFSPANVVEAEDRAPQDAHQRPIVLCIEDDYEMAAMISEELESRGFDVTVANDGRTGRSLLFSSEPNIVLCDVSLPFESGFEILESLGEFAPRFSRTPFVFLTALGARDDELRGRRLGADDYITKPIDFEVLEAILRGRLKKIRLTQSQAAADYRLTEREIEVLKWAARGKTSEEIATIMEIKERTVNFHIDRARQRLGVATRIQAAVKAAVAGLFEP